MFLRVDHRTRRRQPAPASSTAALPRAPTSGALSPEDFAELPRQAERLRTPVLIAHGVNDQVVPANQSQLLAEALRRHGASIESAFYRKSGHGFTDRAEAADFNRRVAAFLALYNPADDATRPAGGLALPISGGSR